MIFSDILGNLSGNLLGNFFKQFGFQIFEIALTTFEQYETRAYKLQITLKIMY